MSDKHKEDDKVMDHRVPELLDRVALLEATLKENGIEVKKPLKIMRFRERLKYQDCHNKPCVFSKINNLGVGILSIEGYVTTSARIDLNQEGWIPWDGEGDPPKFEEGEGMVYEFRNGNMGYAPYPSKYRWKHMGSVADIVAFMRIKKPKWIEVNCEQR